MPQHDLEKLLGGYATNTLTEDERRELFEAALRDQTLFTALADEHALKEVLDDPRSRRLLIQALRNQIANRSFLNRLHRWIRNLAGQAQDEEVQPERSLAGEVREPSPALGASASTEVSADWRSNRHVPSRLRWAALVSTVAVAVLAVTLVLRSTNQPLEVRPATDSTELKRAEKPSPEMQKHETLLVPPEAPPPPTLPLARSKEKISPRPPLPGAAPVPAPPSPEGQENLSRGEQRMTDAVSPGTLPPDLESKQPQSTQGNIRAQTPEQPLEKERKEVKQFTTAQHALPFQEVRRFRRDIGYTLLRQVGGQYTPVDTATNFQTDDAVRIAIEPPFDGYLYALAPDEAGKLKIVFPAEGIEGEKARVEKDRSYILPPEGAFTFHAGAGDRKVLVLFAREPLVVFPEKLDTPAKDKNRDAARKSSPAASERDQFLAASPQPAPAPERSAVSLEIVLQHR